MFYCRFNTSLLSTRSIPMHCSNDVYYDFLQLNYGNKTYAKIHFFLINKIFFIKYSLFTRVFRLLHSIHSFVSICYFMLFSLTKPVVKNVDCFKFVWSILVLFVSFFMSMQ